MGTVVVVIAVIGVLWLAGWMLRSGLFARGPWQTTGEDHGPGGDPGHPHDELTRRSDAPAGPGAESQYVGEAGTAAPAPPPHAQEDPASHPPRSRRD